MNPTAYDIRIWVVTGALTADDGAGLLRTLQEIHDLPETNERS